MQELERATYTVEEIGKILGVGRNSAYDLVHIKGFPKIQIGRKIVVPKEAFNTWLNSQKN